MSDAETIRRLPDARERAEEVYGACLRSGAPRADDGGVDLDALSAEHPVLAAELRAVHADWQRVAGVVAALDAGRAPSDRLRAEVARTLAQGPSLGEGDPEAPSASSTRMLGRLKAHAPRGSRYEVRREIGRGGMGAVLEAWDPDLRRTLAMKVVLRGGEASESARSEELAGPLARFLEEAQVTGQLDHPGIVPVHELGLDDEGRVYFTMRLVKGRDLEKIFELVQRGQEGWNLTRAVRVLLKVAEAMAYAHKKGVIHRDLKPANVMVGPFGEVYVMDWGLARVIGRPDLRDIRLQRVDDTPSTAVSTDRQETVSASADSPLMTMDGQVMGTPAYMPPEQARGEIQRLDARSDVYSLGAILYHLLTGHVPYAPPGKRRTPIQVCLLAQKQPPEPIAEVAPNAPAELVAIAEKAMARRRRDRYDSMLDLAEDLASYLDGHVVRAYEAGALAELKKWVRRNKATASASAAAIVLLLGGLGSTSYVQARANRELGAKNVEIQRERDAGERVIEFLVGLFESPDPRFSRGETVTAKELLDRGASSIDAYRGDDGLVWSRLMDGMGQAYHSLGLYAEAEPLAEKAYRHRLEQLGPEHPDTLSSLNELARVYRSQGRYGDAEDLFQRALETERAVLGERAPATLRTLGDLAYVYYYQGRYEEAVALHLEALEGRRAVLGENDLDTLESRKDLALVYRKLARYDDALALLLEAREGYRAEHLEDHPAALKCLNDLAGVYMFLKDSARAEELYQEVLAERRRVLGTEHPDTLVTLNDLGNLYFREGRYEEAEPLFRQALSGYRTHQAEDHPNAPVILNNLATIEQIQGHEKEAELLFEEAIERSTRVRGADHAYTLAAVNGLAYLYFSEERYDAAEPLFVRAAAGLKTALGAAHPNRLIVLANLVRLYGEQGRLDRAEEVARELVDLTPPDDPQRAEREETLAAILAER